MKFDAQTVDSVVQHMNAEHADACLAIVQAYSDKKEVQRAVLTGLTQEALAFAIYTKNDEANPQPVNVPFDAPLIEAAQIRTALVRKTKAARQLLASRT